MSSHILLVCPADTPSVYAAPLTHAGHSVASVADVACAVHHAVEHLPDLILVEPTADALNGLADFAALGASPDTGLIPIVVVARPDALVHSDPSQLAAVDEIIALPVPWRELQARLAVRLARSRVLRRTVQQQLDNRQRRALDYLDHDLIAPVFTLLAGTELLVRRQPITASTSDEIAVRMHDAAGTLYRHLQNYLLHLQLNGDGDELPDLPLAIPAHSVVADSAHQAAQRHQRAADLQFDLPPCEVPLPSVDLAKITDELIDNACRHSAPGSVIHVRLTHTADACALSVRDAGPGLEPESLDIETDLGLSLARRLARAHRGDLTLANHADGPGACAVVTFPLVCRE